MAGVLVGSTLGVSFLICGGPACFPMPSCCSVASALSPNWLGYKMGIRAPPAKSKTKVHATVQPQTRMSEAFTRSPVTTTSEAGAHEDRWIAALRRSRHRKNGRYAAKADKDERSKLTTPRGQPPRPCFVASNTGHVARSRGFARSGSRKISNPASRNPKHAQQNRRGFNLTALDQQGPGVSTKSARFGSIATVIERKLVLRYLLLSLRTANGGAGS